MIGDKIGESTRQLGPGCHLLGVFVTVIELAMTPGQAVGTFRVEVVRSPAGEASAVIALDVEPLLAQREHLEQAVLASAVASRAILPQIERPVREIGQTLFSALLGSGDVAGRYRASAALAAERGQGLRVVLRADTPALAGLPWEAMYDGTAGAYVPARSTGPAYPSRLGRAITHRGATVADPRRRLFPARPGLVGCREGKGTADTRACPPTQRGARGCALGA